MKDIIVEKIENEIERLLGELTKVDPISDDYKEITSRISDLYETLNKENELTLSKDKLEFDSLKKQEELTLSKDKLEFDSLQKQEELKLSKDKLEFDSLQKQEELRLSKDKLEFDSLQKREELRHSKIWNGVKTGVEIVGVVAPLMFYGIWMNRGLEFEKEGSFTSTTFKGLLGKFKPTK